MALGLPSEDALGAAPEHESKGSNLMPPCYLIAQRTGRAMLLPPCPRSNYGDMMTSPLYRRRLWRQELPDPEAFLSAVRMELAATKEVARFSPTVFWCLEVELRRRTPGAAKHTLRPMLVTWAPKPLFLAQFPLHN